MIYVLIMLCAFLDTHTHVCILTLWTIRTWVSRPYRPQTKIPRDVEAAFATTTGILCPSDICHSASLLSLSPSTFLSWLIVSSCFLFELDAGCFRLTPFATKTIGGSAQDTKATAITLAVGESIAPHLYRHFSLLRLSLSFPFLVNDSP